MSNYQKLLNYYKECFDLVDCFHFNSETAGNVYKRYLPTCKGKVVSITHNGIKDHRQYKDFHQNVLHVGFIGNSTPYNIPTTSDNYSSHHPPCYRFKRNYPFGISYFQEHH